MKLFGQLFRQIELLTNIIEGKVLDKKGRGRTKKSNLEDMYRDMRRAVLDRREWLYFSN